MVWRSAHAVVIQPVERDGAARTKAVGVCQLNVKRNGFELPLRISLNDRAFRRKRSIEVRAFWRKRRAEKSAGRRRRWVALRPYHKGLSSPLKHATKRAAVERGDLIRERSLKVKVPGRVVVFHRHRQCSRAPDKESKGGGETSHRHGGGDGVAAGVYHRDIIAVLVRHVDPGAGGADR